MSVIRVAFLWHMHQPFYKDLATGKYRLPWVRMHALKDYYGMVKLLSEFPEVHQTFNLVPSLITQIEDYVDGKAQDPFLDVALKPAADLTPAEKRFALTYLFQANTSHLIGRYPRYQELWNQFQGAGQNIERAVSSFRAQDFTDLQVLSQIAWFDEYYLLNPDVRALIHKGRDFTLEDQQFVGKFQQKIQASVLPAYRDAEQKGRIEISTSPFYHPILPLLCDSSQGRVSSPNLPLPQKQFARPDDAREQLKRGLDLHEQVFGSRPRGVWPSEGSVSEQVLGIAHELGVQWMATDEGVLGRSLGMAFDRSNTGHLSAAIAEKLYQGYLYRQGSTQMRMVFRDHSLSDLIGFVYSGMPAKEACDHFIKNIKEAAQQVLAKGQDALFRSFLTVRMRGNSIQDPAASSCGAFTMRFNMIRRSRRSAWARRSTGKRNTRNLSRWFLGRGSMRTSMCGSALPKTIAHGIILLMRAIFMSIVRLRLRMRNGNLPLKS